MVTLINAETPVALGAKRSADTVKGGIARVSQPDGMFGGEEPCLLVHTSVCFRAQGGVGYSGIGIRGVAIPGKKPQTPFRRVGIDPFKISGRGTHQALISLWDPEGEPWPVYG